MKIAVYTIALNEAANVREWVESAKDADSLLIADTGSTDDTVAIARDCGVDVIDVRVDPFRFDFARNASLAALPLDLDWCVAVDLDERLQPGWREALEAVPDDVTVARFLYTTLWRDEGFPTFIYWRGRCHRRSGYVWEYMVHEDLRHYGPGQAVAENAPGFSVFHLPDTMRERRETYFHLLQMALRDDPASYYIMQWIVGILRAEGREEEADAEMKRFLAVPNIHPEDRDVVVTALNKRAMENA